MDQDGDMEAPVDILIKDPFLIGDKVKDGIIGGGAGRSGVIPSEDGQVAHRVFFSYDARRQRKDFF